MALVEALRLYTTLRNNTNRFAALYNLANLESERSDSDAAAPLYRETAALAEQLGAARTRLARGLVVPGTRAARVAGHSPGVHDGNRALAGARFHSAVERLEPMDLYNAARLVGECGAEVAEDAPEIWSTVSRFEEHATVQQFLPLAARFTALRDMARRQHTDSRRQEHVVGRTGERGSGDE